MAQETGAEHRRQELSRSWASSAGEVTEGTESCPKLAQRSRELLLLSLQQRGGAGLQSPGLPWLGALSAASCSAIKPLAWLLLCLLLWLCRASQRRVPTAPRVGSGGRRLRSPHGTAHLPACAPPLHPSPCHSSGQGRKHRELRGRAKRDQPLLYTTEWCRLDETL